MKALEPPADLPSSPWLTPAQAAARAQVGRRTIYKEVAAGRLKAAIVGGRRELRLLDAWVDDWLMASAQPILVMPRRERVS